MRRLKKGVRKAFRRAVHTARIENTRNYADLSLRILEKDVLILPTKVEATLREEAAKRFPIPPDASEEEKKRIEQRRDAYIYGTMRRLGWKPEREKEHAT